MDDEAFFSARVWRLIWCGIEVGTVAGNNFLVLAVDKIKVLVSQNEKEPAHPLSSGVRSSGLPWQLDTIEATGLYEKIVKQRATAKIRMEIATK
ncbi:hypothetical protein WOSG25_012490 [Weissella oryzae SG25]|uniref:Uncharacterized protein n=1 Tax=Weissella oryzae (strain DSM 25784 / JCM 18191 / LMG 30913 / SG25) TaxID=1329250 RepID=A0A069CRZ5_WEIOS|nr:hypothetical protein [Weissella oryzae]GAK30152.1 hypothetical protein WOSG25_012490 [Weissella oryzae SG25]